jgi:hypothetical protein
MGQIVQVLAYSRTFMSLVVGHGPVNNFKRTGFSFAKRSPDSTL